MRKIATVLVVATAALGLSWWWTQPAPDWACAEGTDPVCRGRVSLDIDAVGLHDVSVAYQGLAVSPDGNEVALFLTGASAPGSRDDERAVLGRFDAATGSLIAVVRRVEAETGVSGGVVAYSPDGSLLAAEVYVGGGDRIEVLEVATGEEVHRALEHDGRNIIGCRGALGLSSDNEFLQCGLSIVRLGDQSVRPFTDRGFADSDGALAWSRDYVIADSYGSDSTIKIGAPDAEPDLIIDVAATDLGATQWDSLTWRPDGQHIVSMVEAPRWRRWSLDGPRRGHPGAELTSYDVTTGELRSRITIESQLHRTAWSSNGELVVLDRDFTLTRLALR